MAAKKMANIMQQRITNRIQSMAIKPSKNLPNVNESRSGRSFDRQFGLISQMRTEFCRSKSSLNEHARGSHFPESNIKPTHESSSSNCFSLFKLFHSTFVSSPH